MIFFFFFLSLFTDFIVAAASKVYCFGFNCVSVSHYVYWVWKPFKNSMNMHASKYKIKDYYPILMKNWFLNNIQTPEYQSIKMEISAYWVLLTSHQKKKNMQSYKIKTIFQTQAFYKNGNEARENRYCTKMYSVHQHIISLCVFAG